MNHFKLILAAAAAGLCLNLMACTSNGGDGSGNGGGITTGGDSGGDTGGLPNDGSTPTDITDGDTPVVGNFICDEGVGNYGSGVTTVVGSGGLVGGPLTALLNTLGGTTLTDLLNSISEPDNVIDGNLSTYASVSLTAGLLLGVLDSIDESVVLPPGETVPSGRYAVFGVTFPNGTANVSLLNSVAVTTFENGIEQETNKLDQNALTLLRAIGGSGPHAAFIGIKTTKKYDTAQISLTPGVITVNVGDAMRIHELCTDGRIVSAP